jgi:fructose-specific component phosphotransferase system IIB-like protein
LKKFGAGVTIANKMSGFWSKTLVSAFLLLFLATAAATAAAQTAMIDNIQELSEEDNVPVIIKHLPDWEKVKNKAVVAIDSETFSKAVDKHPIALVVAFTPGTEAVVANYDAGKLAIVEFTTPQMATDADAKIQARLGEATSAGQNVPVYRRVGNYAVFVFNQKDEAAANALIDHVKYEKVVQWLGSDPIALRKLERTYIETTSDVVLGAIQITGYILLFTFAVGGFAGFLIFRSRNRQRSMADAYTDAGGMTRLNLDDLDPASTDKLLDSK